jgi:hypothetical protein
VLCVMSQTFVCLLLLLYVCAVVRVHDVDCLVVIFVVAYC